jgi:hypothetical protein
MGDENTYVQRTVEVKHKKEGGKVNRWIVQPMKKLATWEVKDSKKSRVEA